MKFEYRNICMLGTFLLMNTQIMFPNFSLRKKDSWEHDLHLNIFFFLLVMQIRRLLPPIFTYIMMNNRERIMSNSLFLCYTVMNVGLFLIGVGMVYPTWHELDPFQKSWFCAEITNTSLNIPYFLYEWHEIAKI